MYKPLTLFIAGTDTGVGKTVVSCLLIAMLRRQGKRVIGMKPAESGCNPLPMDALSLSLVRGISST